MNRSVSTQPRREFIKKTAVASAAAMSAPSLLNANAAGSDSLGVAIIGCGSKGTNDLYTLLNSTEGTRLVAMADVFQDKLDWSLQRTRERIDDQNQIALKPGRMFVGLDSYKEVLALDDVDLVLLTAPPGFRPLHLRAAIEAGKHVFAEKPAAVDPVGIRHVLETVEMAKQKKLSIVPGMQQRWMGQYKEIVSRAQRGDLGPLTGAKAYWIGTMMDWHYHDRQPEWSDLEYQIRAWPFFTWLSGDCIVEQLVHNIDVVNWALGAHPVSAQGIGGREVRRGEQYGDIWDHFAIEYEYPNGVTVTAMNAQIKGISSRVNNHLIGPDGRAIVSRGLGEITGKNAFKYDGDLSGNAPMYRDLVNGIRKGKPVNMGREFAESTMTGILGRMSAYTGRQLKWDWVMHRSELDLTPAEISFAAKIPVGPHAIPGQTRLV